MNSKQFIQTHRDDWKQLEQLTKQFSKKRKKDLSSTVIHQFDMYYQKAAQNLSYSQTYFPNEEITNYLNQLVTQAHNILYRAEHSSWKQVRTFLTEKFIALLIEQWKAIVIAMLLFIFGGLASFLAVTNDPLHLYSILPTEMAQSIMSPGELEANVNADAIDASLFSAQIMTNNIQVAILAFAGGITFGILTVYLLVYNGVIVGALAGLFWHSGNSYVFWAYILPHGVIELIAIFIAGGAGLLMGYKLCVPGNLTRKYQLKKNTLRSVQLLLGSIPLFVIAAFIEGFITPADLSLELKYAVAALTALAFLAYMLYGFHKNEKLEIKGHHDLIDQYNVKQL